MFVVLLTYVAPLDEIVRLRPDHYAHLDKYFEADIFFLGARRVPPTGGFILAHNVDADELAEIVARDPFVRAGLVTPEIMEIVPIRARAEIAEALGLDPEELRPGAP